jgi:hypothetical protein
MVKLDSDAALKNIKTNPNLKQTNQPVHPKKKQEAWEKRKDYILSKPKDSIRHHFLY